MRPPDEPLRPSSSVQGLEFLHFAASRHASLKLREIVVAALPARPRAWAWPGRALVGAGLVGAGAWPGAGRAATGQKKHPQRPVRDETAIAHGFSGLRVPLR